MNKKILILSLISISLLAGCTTIGKSYKLNEGNQLPYEKRYLIAVLPALDSSKQNLNSQLLRGCAPEMIAALSKTKQYRVVEREQLDKIFKEGEMVQAGLISGNLDSYKKILGVDAIVITEITGCEYKHSTPTCLLAWVESNYVELTAPARLINANNGEIITSEETKISSPLS